MDLLAIGGIIYSVTLSVGKEVNKAKNNKFQVMNPAVRCIMWFNVTYINTLESR